MDQNKTGNLMNEIDIMKIVEAVLKKWWAVVIAALLGAAISLGYTIAFVSPQYSSSVMFYVNTSSTSISSQTINITSNNIGLAKSLVDTYCIILKTRTTLEAVSDSLKSSGLNYSQGQLSGMISSSSVNDTEIFRVTVTCSDPADACTIANTIAQVLPEKMSEIFDGVSVRIVDYAVVSGGRISPSYSQKTLVGLGVGAALAIAVIALLYLLNDTISSEEWLLNTYKDKIPLLATIPDANRSGGSKYSGSNYSKNKYKYGYRYGYGKSRGYYGNYKYGYRNGYYGSRPSQLSKVEELVEKIDTL